MTHFRRFIVLILSVGITVVAYQNCNKADFGTSGGNPGVLNCKTCGTTTTTTVGTTTTVPTTTTTTQPSTCVMPQHLPVMTIHYTQTDAVTRAALSVPDEQTGYTANLYFNDTKGRFEQRPGNDCQNQAKNNPTYVALSFVPGDRQMASCRYRDFADPADQWVTCSADKLYDVNNGVQIVINTDLQQSNGSIVGCPWNGQSYLAPGQPGGWTEVEMIDSLGCTYRRHINYVR